MIVGTLSKISHEIENEDFTEFCWQVIQAMLREAVCLESNHQLHRHAPENSFLWGNFVQKDAF